MRREVAGTTRAVLARCQTHRHSAHHLHQAGDDHLSHWALRTSYLNEDPRTPGNLARSKALRHGAQCRPQCPVAFRVALSTIQALARDVHGLVEGGRRCPTYRAVHRTRAILGPRCRRMGCTVWPPMRRCNPVQYAGRATRFRIGPSLRNRRRRATTPKTLQDCLRRRQQRRDAFVCARERS